MERGMPQNVATKSAGKAVGAAAESPFLTESAPLVRSAHATGESEAPWRLEQHKDLAAIAAAWDAVVPRDYPHLRSGMLLAAERGKIVQDITCILVCRKGEPAAAAVFYTLPIDTLASAPGWVQRFAAWVRQRAPGFLWKSMRLCGSPISNARSGMYFAPELHSAERSEVVALIAQHLVATTRNDQTIYFRDIPESEAADFSEELERQGFFRVTPQPGTSLEIRWKTFDDYLAALRKRYRKRIRDDLKTSKPLDFKLLDSFAELAPTATQLYKNVLANADFNLEVLSEEFFAAVSEFDQAKLLVAQHSQTGDVLGINLLLFAPSHMQNLYIGFDYEQAQRFTTYFSMVHTSLRLAIEHGCRICHFGQDSYEFKARLGAKPDPLCGYMKHKTWPVHWMLRRNRDSIFPAAEAVTHDVFQGEGVETEE
jgi:hypothetical protein